MQDGAHSHAAETVKHPYDGRLFPFYLHRNLTLLNAFFW